MTKLSPLASVSETRAVLEAHGLSTKYSLGQNFLINDAILQKIVALADLVPDDYVLEVGPGIGTLTVALLKSVGRVLSVERDPDLPAVLADLREQGVVLHADERARAVAAAHGIEAEPATEDDWETEYLAPELAVRCVSGVDEAVDHVNRYGTKHSEAIVADPADPAGAAAIEAFLARVDAAAVYANASTAFTDGGQFGLGAEIGISTQKLHARGPFALEARTSYKYVLRGDGQVRA